MPGDPFYWSPEWRKARADYIRRHPTCELPGCGKTTKHVDHKVPRARGGAPLDPRNFMALCHSHHSEKTARQDGGFGHRAGSGGFRGCDARGQPVDPSHPWNRGRRPA